MLRIAGIAWIIALTGSAALLQASATSPLGAVAGRVRNGSGTPQSGAIVVLESRGERTVARTQTGVDGRFRFDLLTPDLYSVRVWASSFVPASRQSVPVRAGMEVMLSVQLASLVSSIELVSAGPAGIVSDEWKWVLRSNPTLRPVLRFASGRETQLPAISSSQSAFSQPSSGILRISGGEPGSDLTSQTSDLGTAFALATSVFGHRELMFSGDVGYATTSGLPSSVFRTRYSGLPGANSRSPDIEFTVRQAGFRQRAGDGLFGAALGHSGGLPPLRSYSMKLQDRQQIGDRMKLDYGLLMEAVAFIDRLNLLSPFAKLSVDLSDNSSLAVAFSSGAPAADSLPIASSPASPAEALVGLRAFPRISLQDGQARLQRSTNFEAGYRLNLGLTRFDVSAYRERLSNQAFVLAGDTSAIRPSDLLPDLASSSSSVFNFGSFTSTGYVITATRSLSDSWKVTGSFGSGGALRTDGSEGLVDGAAALRQRIRVSPTRWASTKLSGMLPKSGTMLAAAYIWTPAGRVIPTHTFLTQEWQPALGLNFQFRQPLPAISGLPGRFEMTAEVRNLLAQGYLPVPSSDGRTMLLVPFPRSLRGGVSFIF